MPSEMGALPTYFFLSLSFFLSHSLAQSSNASSGLTPSLCHSPSGFANTIVLAPLPSSQKLKLKDSFLFEHVLFSYTDQNTALSQAAFASYCLDQCIAYQPDPNAVPFSTVVTSLPPSYVGNNTGPCLGFTVNMGKPYPPNPNDTATRWYCEAFDKSLAVDLSDFEPIDTPGSYMFQLGVNRACSGNYRAF